jgi:eukaryotic-like serine/threonine-protein kinase
VPELAPDTIVDGRYRIVRRLGAGGMAEVYCAEDSQLGRQVALKLLYRRFAEDAEFVERFRREASAAAGLQHPNVVQVFDRGEWDGTYYIAMEFIPGRTLKEVVRDHGALEPALAADLTTQILRAARFAHRRGVVHRDLKPQNVLVDEEGRAKVADFGIARAGASDMTETGSVMGTAQYLSPEQAQGLPVDLRSDLYSIGVILYELLTGVVPFDAESPVTVALKQVSEAPVPAIQRNPAIPPALDAVVMHALRKDPDARFQDADGFADAIEAALAGGYVERTVVEEPVVDDDPGWSRAVVIALIVLAVAAIAVGAYLLLTPDKERVPNVVDKRAENATQTLQEQGFEVNVVAVESDTVDEDRVVEQDPAGGTEAEAGSEVTISVSTGPGEAVVPLVQGLPADEAADRMRDAGFRTERREEFSDTVRKNRVIETSPAEGESVRKGSTITLVVSRGKEKTAVPDVVGQPQDQATATLRAAGFEVGTTEREDAQADPGTVLEQDPAAGTQAAEGAQVTLTVATEPAEVAVPDVAGQEEDDAQRALEDAGFDVQVVDEPVETPDEDGIVTAQDPGADETAAPGSEITITVGRFELPDDPEPEPTGTATPEPEPEA